MFRNAYRIASSYTIPIVISQRTVSGKCSCSIATAIVVNSDGWIVTASHVLKNLAALQEDVVKVSQYTQSLKAIEADLSLNRQQKRAQISSLRKPKPNDIVNWSIWFGFQAEIEQMLGNDEIDLAVAKLSNLGSDQNRKYPSFLDPGSSDLEPGTSLCRMGFPFHYIEPIWREETQGFELPFGAVPLPLFPNEGILSRSMEMIFVDEQTHELIKPPFPYMMIETSSPGVRGQSGGPIFDVEGTVWGVQSSTISHELDLNTREPQYYHVGAGVHPSTLIGFFDSVGINYQKVPYK